MENGTKNHQEELENVESAPPFPSTAPPSAPVNEITDYMRKGLDIVAVNEGFVNYTVKEEKGSNVGDGFIGIMFRIHFQEVDSDKHLTVMLKAPPASLARRNQLGALKAFKREVFMYNKVLPAFVAFQKEKFIKEAKGFFNFPKVYFAEFDEELQDSVIIMEDLKESGCKMWDKFVPIDFEHSKLVLESLGRFHAISFAMKEQHPEIFDKLKNLDEIFFGNDNNDFDNFMEGSMDRAIEGLPEDAVSVKIKLERMRAKGLKNLLANATDPDKAEPYAVISHGDCWTNNFMYKYQRNCPKKVIFLDWQISRYSSPVLDLMYFIFCSTDSAIRTKHYDELIRIYHKSLQEQLDNLGGNVMKQFPFTALMRQLKSYGKFGVMMGIFIIPMITTKTEDLPDMDQIANNVKDQNLDAMADIMAKMAGKSNKRLSDAIIDSAKYGYL